MNRIVIATGLIVIALSIVMCGLPGRASKEMPPQIESADEGAPIADVTLEAYGVTKAEIANRYLSLRAGGVLSQGGVLHDYTNLVTLAGLGARLQIKHRTGTRAVELHWIVIAKLLASTDHPFYRDQPLTIPIEGFGSVITSGPLDSSGATVSSYSQLALRAQLARIVYTKPVSLDSASGEEHDFIANVVDARGDFQQGEPITQDVYSSLVGAEVLFLMRGTNGTQAELGFRVSRSTSNNSTFITAPSIYDTYYHPARASAIEVGLSHGCPVLPTQLFPPHCYLQYRIEAVDAIGGLGANIEYRAIAADAAQYNRIGSSTLVFHGALSRTGGVLATSGLTCAYTFGYAAATCGTDANLVQTEFRLADARPGLFKFILFTETAASRIREGAQPFAPGTFQWRADSGVGLQYRGFRFNIASGSDGGRITYEVQGQLF